MEDKLFEVKFHFGAKKISQKRVYITALILNLAVQLLHKFFRLSPQLLWELIDIIGQDFKIDVINQIILQAPELLEDRIEREVDDAIKDYNGEVGDIEFPKPDYWEDPDGSIGFTYTFMEKDNEQGRTDDA